ncbi:ras-related protein rab7-like [Pristis pectinata]|uniref:ras-related protein rab7-like n=1 Tax=Pristis pectinata TaxID=685728 RepID=UPI00223E8EA7|nr:ras-related protein rab7-like [Pristis pectinata]
MSTRKRNQLKMILLGNSGVGKSSLMNQFVNKRYTNLYRATIGADFLTRDLTVDDNLVTVQVWDTAGTERFQSLGSILYRNTDCCLLVYDVTSADSFRALEGWRQEFVLQGSPRDPDTFPFLVLGNKTDLDNREVSRKLAEDWCRTHKMEHFETSAKEARNVEEVFRSGVRATLNQLKGKDRYVEHPDQVQLQTGKPSREWYCTC